MMTRRFIRAEPAEPEPAPDPAPAPAAPVAPVNILLVDDDVRNLTCSRVF